MCFAHALLNAVDMDDRGYEVRLIIEGSSTKLVPELTKEGKPFADLFAKVKDRGLIDCACKACSAKMGVLEDVQTAGIELNGEMQGHPSVATHMEQGFEILVF